MNRASATALSSSFILSLSFLSPPLYFSPTLWVLITTIFLQTSSLYLLIDIYMAENSHPTLIPHGLSVQVHVTVSLYHISDS